MIPVFSFCWSTSVTDEQLSTLCKETFWNSLLTRHFWISLSMNNSSKAKQSDLHYMKSWKICISMMTSSNGNIFRVTGPLCGEFTGHRWIPLTKANDAELCCFLWSAPWINGWVNNREVGDLRHHCAHYDIIAMRTTLTVPDEHTHEDCPFSKFIGTARRIRLRCVKYCSTVIPKYV